jgi:hypothetical protein
VDTKQLHHVHRKFATSHTLYMLPYWGIRRFPYVRTAYYAAYCILSYHYTCLFNFRGERQSYKSHSSLVLTLQVQTPLVCDYVNPGPERHKFLWVILSGTVNPQHSPGPVPVNSCKCAIHVCGDKIEMAKMGSGEMNRQDMGERKCVVCKPRRKSVHLRNN